MKTDSVISGIFSLILIYIFLEQIIITKFQVLIIKFKKISLTFVRAILEWAPLNMKNKDKREIMIML